MKDRNAVVDAIKEHLQKVCKGWGVHLEAVEICEVLISSSSLFKDLQADFREKMHQHAEMIKMNINTELDKFRAKEDEDIGEFRSKNQAEIANIRNLCNLAIKDMQEKGKLEQQKIIEEKAKDQAEYNFYVMSQDNIFNKKNQEI
jgi:hypothetical protein